MGFPNIAEVRFAATPAKGPKVLKEGTSKKGCFSPHHVSLFPTQPKWGTRVLRPQQYFYRKKGMLKETGHS